MPWKYAASNGFEVAREFTDEPARRVYRESFAEMTAFLRAQRDVRNIVVEQPNHLSRKMKSWAEFDELTDKMGVEVHWAKMSKTPLRVSGSDTKKVQNINVEEAIALAE